MRSRAPAALRLAQRIDAAGSALLFDFDGVLVDLAATPDAIRVPDGLGRDLERMERRAGGALAIVTGRSAADLRRHLPGAPRHVLASHGAERDEAGRTSLLTGLSDPAAVQSIQARVADLATGEEGLLAESKPMGAVLHYRGAPDRGADLRRPMEGLARSRPGFELHPAKMAWEIRPRGAGKDRAVKDLMQSPPFHGRVPVYFGDDTTDEPVLDWVRREGGVSVKVGAGDTAAEHRLDAPSDVHALIGELIGNDVQREGET